LRVHWRHGAAANAKIGAGNEAVGEAIDLLAASNVSETKSGMVRARASD
jgi:hypothetical protein